MSTAVTRGSEIERRRGPAPRVGPALVGVLLFATAHVGFRTTGYRLPAETSVLLLVGALVAIGLVDRSRIRRIPTSSALVLLWCWMCLSILWSDDVATTMRTVGRDVAVMVALTLLAGVARFETLFTALLWTIRVTIVVTVVAVIALPQARTLIDPNGVVPDVVGWRGLFIHKNQLASFLLIATVTVLCFDHHRRSRYATLAATATLLVGSRSLIGATGALLAVAVWGWLQSDATRVGVARRRVRLATAALTPLAVLGAALVVVPLSVALGKGSSLSGRTDIWVATSGAWAERPLLGFGLGGIYAPRPPTSRTLELWQEIGFDAAHAHNGLLSVGVQLGAIGVVIWGALFVSNLVDAVRLRSTDPALAGWSIALMIAQLYVSIGEDVFIGSVWIGMPVLFKVVLLRRTQELRAAATPLAAEEAR